MLCWLTIQIHTKGKGKGKDKDVSTVSCEWVTDTASQIPGLKGRF